MKYCPLEQKNTILPRIAKHDATAVEDCIKTYGNLVWSIAKKYIRSTQDAEDAVQEIFIAIWQNAWRYDETKAAEITFVSVIAKRRLIDRLRKNFRQPMFQPLTEMCERSGSSTESQIQNQIQAKRAFKEVQSLRANQRDLILLNACEGMSHNEIAEKTGIPLGTVKTNIRRGFATLRDALSENRSVRSRVSIV